MMRETDFYSQEEAKRMAIQIRALQEKLRERDELIEKMMRVGRMPAAEEEEFQYGTVPALAGPFRL